MTTYSYRSNVLKRQTSRRRLLAATGATTVSAALLAACGGGGGGELKVDDAASARQPGTVWFEKNNWKLADETKQAVRGGIYRAHRADDVEGHLDLMTQPTNQPGFIGHTHEPLMFRTRGPGIDPGSVAASVPTGALAEAWEISPDGTTVTFTMRQGVKWHPVAPTNGRVMDMEDWRTCHEKHMAVGSLKAALTLILDKAEWPDQRHMVWKFKNPYAAITSAIWQNLVIYALQPKELNANMALAEVTSIGTGYKILDKLERSVRVEFRKHAEYWGGDPFIERWHQPILPEYANRYAQFVSGNIMDFTPTARDVLAMAKDAPETVIVAQPIPDNNVTRLRFGHLTAQDRPWKDPRVRIAIRQSMDFKSVGEFLANKSGLDAAGIPIEVSPMTHLNQDPTFWLNPEKDELGPLSAHYNYSPAEAKKMTTAAGYSEPIEATIIALQEEGEVPEVDQLLIDSWSRSGTFKVNVNLLRNALEHDSCKFFGACDGLVTQSGSSGEADRFIFRDYHSEGNLPRGPQAYPDPRLDALAVTQRQEMDPQKRLELLKDFQRLAAELMPTIPGRHLYTSLGFRWPWLHNINHGESGSPPAGWPVSGGHLQWLDKDMPNRDKII
jgi:ABC-type transport system substrate-binding protein